MNFDYDCAIIGGGPGGLVSALYLKRFLRKTILIKSGLPRAAWIPKTHNLIGYQSGISGRTLLSRLQAQVEEYKLPFINSTGVAQHYKSGFKINFEKGSVTAKKIIFATGIKDTQLDIPNLTELRRKGLLRYCAVCDAFEHQGKKLAVFIADEMGLEKALFLLTFTKNILFFEPSNFQISKVKFQTLKKLGIKLIRGALESIELSHVKKGIWIKCKGLKEIFCEAAYLELGYSINNQAFQSLRGIRRVKEGLLRATSEQRLSIPGLFAVGDCVNILAQIGVAAGQAAVAATTIHNDLLTEIH